MIPPFKNLLIPVICFLTGTINIYCQSSLANGLVAYYPFNGTLNDESGYKNHPVTSNVTFTKGKKGDDNTACYFNGINCYIRISNSKSLTPSQMTLVAIVKPMGFYMGKCYNNSIIDKGTSDYLPGVYALRFTAGEYTNGDCDDPALAYQNFVGSCHINPGTTSKNLRVKLDNWYCIVYTVSDTEEKLYVNGRLMSSRKKIIEISANKDDLFLGRKNNPQYPYWFKGVMDEIRIYNRALNAEEVKALCGNPDPVTDCTGKDKVSAKFGYTISDCNVVAFSLAESESKNLKKVTWTFGDGFSSDKKNPVHVYKKYGAYKIRAIVISKSGCVDTILKQVQLEPVKAVFTYAETNTPGELNFRVKNNKASYKWSFGDGQKANNESIVTHQYAASGSYTATLYATNNAGCNDSISKQIDILLPDTALITSPGQATPEPQLLSGEKVPDGLQKRTKELARNIEVTGDSITVSLYDNGMIDGDSITLVYNSAVIVTKQVLKSKPLTLRLPVDSNKPSNELIMYAENLGAIPPNTALMIIYDGEKRFEVPVSSTLQSNGVVSFTLRK